MKGNFRNLLLLFVFWIVLFQFNQLFFIVFNYGQLKQTELTEVLSSFYHALALNLSTACYLTALPLVFTFFQAWINKPFSLILLKAYVLLILVLIISITTAEIEIYHEWGSKLSLKALMYLKKPREVLETSSNKFTFFFIVSLLVQVYLFFKLYISQFQKPLILWVEKNKFKKVLYPIFGLLFSAVLLVIGLRGGLQQIPINQSSAYFSKNQLLNLAATNSSWNIIHSVWANRKLTDTNPYQFFNQQEAEAFNKSMHEVKKDTTQLVLNRTKPNIVLIVLEGWDADIIGSCGGDSSITPHFNRLSKEGVLFSNCYSSGMRSEQGMCSIFSGFPAQPLTSIIEQPDKFVKLPSLNRPLKEAGYYSSYYFGGQLSYGNIESYMIYNGMDKIVDLKSLPSHLPQGKLGVHDEFMYSILLDEIPKQKAPFFTTLFTGSTHSPYDVPKSPKRKWGSEMDAYANSAIYADSCLNVFFEQAKKQSWYNNTLFILVADHGHLTHRYFDYYDPLHHKIPMLWLGGALKNEFKGFNYTDVCSQTDLPASLLAQLELPFSPFIWSKNLFNPYTRSFAYYTFPRGFGWVQDSCAFAYDAEGNQFYYERFKDSSRKDLLVKQGKSYLQSLFQEYLDY